MRSQIRSIRRPSLDEELEPESTQTSKPGGNDLNDMIQKISLENVSLEERRQQAKKPLYLVRYE
jgi:hypothetical protein